MIATFIEVLDSGVAVLGLLLLVLGASSVTYYLTRLSVKAELEAIKGEIAESLALRSAVEELMKSRAGVTSANQTPVPVIAIPKPVVVPASGAITREAVAKVDEIAHETLVVIAAAVAAFLGKSVRLRSARLIEPVAGSPWAQQGRVYVQASHNLGMGQRAHG